jgi:hypothetical protein
MATSSNSFQALSIWSRASAVMYLARSLRLIDRASSPSMSRAVPSFSAMMLLPDDTRPWTMNDAVVLALTLRALRVRDDVSQ